jgi:hypothetical protein
MKASNRGSLLRLLLQVFGFAFCVLAGILLSELTDEVWCIAVGIGVGLIVGSAIGVILEVRKPITHQNSIESYTKRILFILYC